MRKHERRKIDAFELWCRRRVLRVSWIEIKTDIYGSSRTSESESEIHLFEPHSIQNKYFNVISNYKTWIGRPLLRPSGRYRRGHQNYNINYYEYTLL